MAKTDDWKKNLKAGDLVVLVSRFRGARVCRVEKVTALHVLAGGRKWRRTGYGYVGSGPWPDEAMHEATPELLAKVAHANRAERLSRETWVALPFDLTEKVCALLDEHDAKKEADRE